MIVIPSTCTHEGVKHNCKISFLCVLDGGTPLDHCSGGDVWSCCIEKKYPPVYNTNSQGGFTQNNSK